ncbi:MAG TPA: hypothetical protein VLH40_01450 [Atribacteraceae bacterium]|nr:hypothetical protein [Atribacteraceae bacterium]
MRRVSGFEMVVVYASLLGLFFTLVFWRNRLELWVVGLCSLGMMLPFALAIPNVGTLYRLRFGPLLLLVALGITGFIRWRSLRR